MLTGFTDLFGVDGKWPLALAIDAIANPHLPCCILVERSQDSPAFLAVEFNVFELREDATTPGYHTSHPDEVVEIRATEVAEGRA